MGPKMVHLGPESLVGLGNFILLFQLENQRHQGLGNETTAEITKTALVIGTIHKAVEKIVCHLKSLSLLCHLKYGAMREISSHKFTSSLSASLSGDTVPRP